MRKQRNGYPATRNLRVLSFAQQPSRPESDADLMLDDEEVALIQRYRALDRSAAYTVSVVLLTRQERELVEQFRELTDTQQLAFSTAIYLDAFRNIQARISRTKAGVQHADRPRVAPSGAGKEGAR